jgi:isopenicillin-N epimerase
VQLPAPSPLASHWTHDSSVTFLNHGSFGGCPKVVIAAQRAIQDEIEREPVRFLHRELEQRLDVAREALCEVVDCDPQDLVFVRNATEGVNTVLRSLQFAPCDELLTIDHEYNATQNAMRFVAERSGARVVIAHVPFPLRDSQQVVDAVLAAVTPRTKLLVIDHITSPTGIVLPIERLIRELDARGIDTLVDGAHGPGMVPLSLRNLGAAYYTGNCHKWLCTPKGSALLFVRRDRQARIRPLAISHAANTTRTDRPFFWQEFDWTGTFDPSPVLTLPTALKFLDALMPGGLPSIQRHNRALALAARDLLCAAVACDRPAPDDMIGSLAAVPLPQDRLLAGAPVKPFGLDPLQVALMERHRIEIPVMNWPSPKLRLIRVAPQAYNSIAQYEALAAALRSMLG